MSISSDILASMRGGSLSRSCNPDFPQKTIFISAFWDMYWPVYKHFDVSANYDDYIQALDNLVEQGHLTVSGDWYS